MNDESKPSRLNSTHRVSDIPIDADVISVKALFRVLASTDTNQHALFEE